MGGKLQWWHILIFVVAAVLILWRVGTVTIGSRQTAEVRVVEGENVNPEKPGTPDHQKFEEK